LATTPIHQKHLKVFEDYEFFGTAGEGAQGEVMVVRHKQQRDLRACKVVKVQSSRQRELIDTEVTLLRSLQHPGILKLHEVYFDEQLPGSRRAKFYLVSELCEGGDLASRISFHDEMWKQPMPEAQAAATCQQILAALSYCHSRGVVHRDVKPENILFANRSVDSPIRIIDFGLADFVQSIRESAKEVKVPRTGAVGRLARMLPSVRGKHLLRWHERKQVMRPVGTPHYMAPEVYEGSYDQKADLFSVGIILCELLCGAHPFREPVDTPQTVREKIMSPLPVDLPGDMVESRSPEACDLCQQLLQKAPALRPSADQALNHRFAAIHGIEQPFR
jgi:calcium-dependent protein kinase